MSRVIYRIVNTINANFYVGSTNNFYERTRNHRKLLNRGTHHCAHLQAAWSKYGKDAFRMEIVEEVADNDALFAAEQRWLDECVGRPDCYNHSKFADAPMRGRLGADHPQFGVPKPEWVRDAISTTLKAQFAADPTSHPRLGKTFTEASKAKMSASRTGQNAGADHYRYGTTLSEEVRKKIGDAQRGVPKGPGRKVSAEGMEKIRQAAEAGSYSHWAGKKHTEEAKAKMRKPVAATSPEGVETTYPSVSDTLTALDLLMPTINRALKSGLPLSRGPRKGWSFRYA